MKKSSTFRTKGLSARHECHYLNVAVVTSSFGTRRGRRGEFWLHQQTVHTNTLQKWLVRYQPTRLLTWLMSLNWKEQNGTSFNESSIVKHDNMYHL